MGPELADIVINGLLVFAIFGMMVFTLWTEHREEMERIKQRRRDDAD